MNGRHHLSQHRHHLNPINPMKNGGDQLLSNGKSLEDHLAAVHVAATRKNGSTKRRNGDDELREKAYEICRNFLSGSWKKISSSDMEFKPISGGLSNLLYYCSLPATHTPLEGEPNQVLLRMYGQIHDGSGNSENTITESVIFMLLSERQLGPKLYGVFSGGRLEEYIPARAMHNHELRDPTIAAIIARKLASVHSLDVPICKQPKWLRDTYYSWLDFVRTEVKLDNVPEERLPIARELLNFDFESEIRWLITALPQCKSPVVFCHNDLQQGNVLLPTEGAPGTLDDHKVVIIDFEYCAYNYRGFDMGGHFCERCFDYNGNDQYPYYVAKFENYPNENERRYFIREYLKQWRKIKGEHSLDSKLDTEDHLLIEVAYGTIAAHLLWTLWSIKNAYTSNIQFGYWDYGKTRLNHYLRHKKQLEDMLSKVSKASKA